MYDDGEPMSYSAVEIKGPDSDIAFQTGRTDRNGLMMSQPDRPGPWQAVVSDGMGHLVVTEDLPHLFDPGTLHTDERPRLEYAAPRRLYAGGLDLEIAASDRLRITAATRTLLTGHDRVEDLLNLIELGASIHLPLFARLDPSGLDEDRQARYMNIVKNYCTATLMPSFRVLGNDRAKQACAELQIQGIERHLARSHGRPADHYNLGLSLAALRLAPNDVVALNELGLVRLQQGQAAEAHASFSAALALSEPDGPANVRTIGN